MPTTIVPFSLPDSKWVGVVVSELSMINTPDAVARQKTDFGDAVGFGEMGAEHVKMDAGTDIAPLLRKMGNGLCQGSRWGDLINGDLPVSHTDGKTEDAHTGNMVYYPPGHSVQVNKDADFAWVRPQHEKKPQHYQMVQIPNGKINSLSFRADHKYGPP